MSQLVGSNFGSFAEFIRLSLRDTVVFCCEIGEYYVKECRKRYPKLSVIEEKLTENKILGHFDFIYCCDVIEHIWDLDDFIKGIKTNLNVGAHLLVVTPNLDCIESKVKSSEWWAYIVPHHSTAEYVPLSC